MWFAVVVVVVMVVVVMELLLFRAYTNGSVMKLLDRQQFQFHIGLHLSIVSKSQTQTLICQIL